MKNTLKYSLHMQKNPMHPEEPEKAYATLQLNGVLDINALAAHMANHNSIYSKGTIVGIITDMCHCIKEAITEGNAIELGAGLDFKREDFDFEFTTTRKAQAAAKKAQKKGEKSADWSEE